MIEFTYIYILVAVPILIASIPLFFDEEERKFGARAVLCASVWPIALVVLLVVGIVKLFVIAEWVPKEREDKGRVHLHNPSQRPIEGGMKRASNAIEARPMTAIPKPPKR